MSIKLTTMQAAYLTRAMTTGGGLIELGELAKGLGKQKGHVVRKLESNFDPSLLSKMESKEIQVTGLSRSVGCDFRVQTKGVHVNVSTRNQHH
ncbi:hypothetical protein H8O99_000151 [Escherichia coli]|nr:hypothetical protein [Escherichia coli]